MNVSSVNQPRKVYPNFVGLFKIIAEFDTTYLAGFDGYSHDEKENYGESTMAFVTKTAVLDAMNQGMTEMLKKYSELVELNFLTKPHYVKI